MKRITLVVHDLSGNPIVRASAIAEALEEMGYQVKVVGLLIGSPQLYEPFKNRFNFDSIYCGEGLFGCLLGSYRVSRLIEGDYVYAFKPLITTFFPALVYKAKNRKIKLFLDVEDEDISFSKKSFVELVRLYFRGWRSVTEYKYNKWLSLCLGYCDIITVASTRLQTYYGGFIVKTSSAKVGTYIENVPTDRIKLFFAGKAQGYKGFDLLPEVVSDPFFIKNFELHLVGDPSQPYFLDLQKKSPQAVKLHGMVAVERMSGYITQFNVALVLQKPMDFTKSQVPAKLIESLALGKPVLTTNVGDIPEIIFSQGKKSGWLVKGYSSEAVLDQLRYLVCNHTEIQEFSFNALENFTTNFGCKNTKNALKKIGF